MILTVRLRPHHIAVLQEHFEVRATLQNASASRDERIWASQIRDMHVKYSAVYQGSGWKQAMSLADMIAARPDLEIIVTRGEDDICSACRFVDDCSRGEYRLIFAAYAEQGLALEENANPLTADEKALEILKLAYGSTLTAGELLSLEYLPLT